MIAVISDIHGNLEALNRVLAEIDNLKILRIWCLGDLVGYGADPNQCIETVKDRCEICIVGNHDWAALGKTDISYFNPVAKQAILWTKEVLTDESIRFLEGLDLTASEDDFLLVHASPSRPDEWEYLFEMEQFQNEFSFFTEKVCLIGHSHVPVIADENLRIHRSSVTLETGLRYIINIGSVGQPRDGDHRASFATIDEDRIEIRRVEYDVETARKKILQAGLPPFLADRLKVGR